MASCIWIEFCEANTYCSSRYTTIDVGDPPQALEIDLDLLTPDFYTVLTTSNGGHKYNTFGSHSHGQTDYSHYCIG